MMDGQLIFEWKPGQLVDEDDLISLLMDAPSIVEDVAIPICVAAADYS